MNSQQNKIFLLRRIYIYTNIDVNYAVKNIPPSCRLKLKTNNIYN